MAYIKIYLSGAIFFLTCSEKMQEDLIRLGCKREKIFVQKYGVTLQKFKPFMSKPKKGNKVKLLSVRRKERAGIRHSGCSPSGKTISRNRIYNHW